MTDRLTDAELEAIRAELDVAGFLGHAEAYALLAKVDALREEAQRAETIWRSLYEEPAIERAEKAQAEVDALRERLSVPRSVELNAELRERADKAEAERDRMRAVVEAARAVVYAAFDVSVEYRAQKLAILRAALRALDADAAGEG